MLHRKHRVGFWSALAFGSMLGMAGCGEDNPTSSPPAPRLDTANRMIVVRDSSLAEPAWSLYFFHLTWTDTVTKTMSFDAEVGRTHPGSIYSEANNTARALSFADLGRDPECDSIVGIEYHLMAKSSSQTNFVAFLERENGEIRSPLYYFGIGFDKSDSLKVVWTSEGVASQQNKNIRPIQFGRWYKCTIEYDVVSLTAKYYLDDELVFSKSLSPNPFQGFNTFTVYRDSFGRDGSAPYYFNDFTLYDIQKKSP